MADAGENASLRYNNKVTIVTGGCQGVGRGIADVFIKNGAQVVVFDINDEMGFSLSTSGPGEIHFIHCDVTKEDDVKKAIEETVLKYERIDCLVNNAGHHPGYMTIDDMSVDGFRKVMDLNVTGYFLTCKYALPHLREVKGNIINNASILGVIGSSMSCSYCASKGAVCSLTMSLAVDESKHGVRVNSICPGPIQTALLDTILPTAEAKSEIASCNLQNRFADTSEIGQVCLFLAADATFMTGVNLNVSGGAEVGFGHKM